MAALTWRVTIFIRQMDGTNDCFEECFTFIVFIYINLLWCYDMSVRSHHKWWRWVNCVFHVLEATQHRCYWRQMRVSISLFFKHIICARMSPHHSPVKWISALHPLCIFSQFPVHIYVFVMWHVRLALREARNVSNNGTWCICNKNMSIQMIFNNFVQFRNRK